MPSVSQPSVLMLCLGNICRSPLAEGALRQELARRGLDWRVDSAGTGGWHAGEPPDGRSVAVAKAAGVDISTQRARALTTKDFEDFDWIVAMDRSCLATAEARRPEAIDRRHARLVSFLSFTDQDGDVPDPYYGGQKDFEHVWHMLRDGMPRLVDALETSAAHS